ncbi:Sensor histidine kinase YehU [termite gut metagenome]|uniref:Sensor histidine kinase YehU n=1 Tax=termite gut metagenome TaxID=433724 RepID=A0A5J4SPS1_9ZZZZ
MLIVVSFIAGAFIIYPRIIDLPWELPHFVNRGERIEHILFFIYRYLFFCLLTWILLLVNIRKQNTLLFSSRLLKTFFITVMAYALYVLISLAISKHVDCFTGLLLFQFVVAFLLCSFTGHVFALYSEKRKQELEIEKLKTENLQSRCEALTNQINPHFFFNSLNGLAALVRTDKKTQTLRYIHELSGVFRYILQSNKKGIVHLSDELRFLDSFRYLQEMRYADNFTFDIRVPEEKRNMLIPVLSLLPLIENIVKHNMIDSENAMEVSITMNAHDELVITNPIHKKIEQPDPNGIGLKNLSDRFEFLLNKKIRSENKENLFIVYLPLIRVYTN